MRTNDGYMVVIHKSADEEHADEQACGVSREVAFSRARALREQGIRVSISHDGSTILGPDQDFY